MFSAKSVTRVPFQSLNGPRRVIVEAHKNGKRIDANIQQFDPS